MSAAASTPQSLTKTALRVDVCGKRTLDYVAICLAKFNRAAEEHVVIRAIGGNISKGVGVSQILVDEFGFRVQGSRLHRLHISGTASSCLEIDMTGPTERLTKEDVAKYSVKDDYVDFPVYHLMFDAVLARHKSLRIETFSKRPLLTITATPQTFMCSHATGVDTKHKEGITDAYYRCGLLVSPYWEKVAKALSVYDDVILGIDTNLLMTAAMSEQIINSLSLIDPRVYVHTPNWVFIVIPNTVVHELEQFANCRDDYGYLKELGRIGFRALQEILELNRCADFSGVSLTVVGTANPVLDAKVELVGLREDFCRREFASDSGEDSAESTQDRSAKGARQSRPTRSPKTSSGDMMIRAQYKEFLRQIDFHKGVFFLTADKSCAAMARAEGLHAIYYKPPYYGDVQKDVYPQKRSCKSESSGSESDAIELGVPIGKLLYELAVQFQTIRVSWGDGGSAEIQCDSKGDSLDHWLMRDLRIDANGLSRLLGVYREAGKISLVQVGKVWNETMDRLLGNEII